LATSPACQYKNQFYNFTCDEPTRDTSSKLCIFHDINYLKDDNYEKHKEEVSKRFAEKLSEYSSNHTPLEFIGYCLPDVSFQNKQFTEALYFNDATFYGAAYFSKATFSDYVYFGATFYNKAYFDGATFSKEAYFSKAIFSNKAYLMDMAHFYSLQF
jgi:Pentapeptide repeats (9 copies)